MKIIMVSQSFSHDVRQQTTQTLFRGRLFGAARWEQQVHRYLSDHSAISLSTDLIYVSLRNIPFG